RFQPNRHNCGVYLMIGNLPKAVRQKPSSQACILLAYFSVDKIGKAGTKLSQTQVKTRNCQLFHESMKIILEPLKQAEKEGILMTSGDGLIRRVYPVLAS
ncbi:hypothetical protein K435DRAFT_694263, partial [Dendrothele bispora CBS 962.96]